MALVRDPEAPYGVCGCDGCNKPLTVREAVAGEIGYVFRVLLEDLHEDAANSSEHEHYLVHLVAKNLAGALEATEALLDLQEDDEE